MKDFLFVKSFLATQVTTAQLSLMAKKELVTRPAFDL